MEEGKLSALADRVGCKIENLPFNYLGMPLGDNPKKKCFWEPVIEKVTKRLASWKKGYFSKGGRLTLIQSVLSSIPTYYLSIFKMPASIREDLERIMRNFLWEGSGEGKGAHLVNWKTVSRPMNEGGLGIGNLDRKNMALLVKWLWRFPNEPNSLWHKVIRSKYGIHSNGWDTNIVIRGESMEGDIQRLPPVF